MTLINLRPWREERRQERQQRFLTLLVMMALVAAALVMVAGFVVEGQTAKQQQRNEFLRQEMTRLDAKIREIKDLKAKRERLLERLQAIQDLQGNRPVIVRVFDELVRVLPEELYYTALMREGDMLHVTGRARGNKDVSELMRNLDRSTWFTDPNLSAVGNTDQGKSFDMSVVLSKRKQEGEGKGGA